MTSPNLPDPHNPLGFVALVEARLDLLDGHLRELRAVLKGYTAGVADSERRQAVLPDKERGGEHLSA